MNQRKLTVLNCKWCGEPFESERSDAKYCCESHNKKACYKRRVEKRNRKLNNERQFRIEKQEKFNPVVPISVPPTSGQNNSDEKVLADFRKEMNAMFEKANRDIEIADKKYELEKYCRQFSKLAELLLGYAEYGSVGVRDIRSLASESNLILANEKIRKHELLQKHLSFVENELVEYLEELMELERDCEFRRLDFELPEAIFEGLEMLVNPVSF